MTGLQNKLNQSFFDRAFKFTFLLSVFLLPFDDLTLSALFLKEFLREGFYIGIWLFYALFCFYLCCGGKLNFHKIPLPLALSVISILIIHALSLFANFYDISTLTAFYKNRNGLYRFFSQESLILFFFFWLLLFFSVDCIEYNKAFLENFLKIVFYSFVLVVIVVVIEIFAFWGHQFARDAIALIHCLTFAKDPGALGYIDGFRVSSVTGEPSFLGMYLSFAYPFCIAYTCLRKKPFIALLVVWCTFAMVIFSRSRTMAVLITAETPFLLGGIFFIRGSQIECFRKRFMLLIFGGILIFFLFSSETIFNAIGLLLKSAFVDMNASGVINVSNITRKGFILSGFKMGLEHPFLGVGVGQYGILAKNYLPAWIWMSPEMSYHMYQKVPHPMSVYALIAAEWGFTGLVIWCFLYFYFLKKSLQFFCLRSISSEMKVVSLAFSVAVLGAAISAINKYTFFCGFWVLMILIHHLEPLLSYESVLHNETNFEL